MNIPQRSGYYLKVFLYYLGLYHLSKARITKVGSVKGDVIADWSFDCMGEAVAYNFFGGKLFVCGYTVEELRAIAGRHNKAS